MLDPRYDHKTIEEKIYPLWEKSGYFNPDNLPTSKSFTVIMPPPNANGALHIGHAMFVTLEDIMIRFSRMQGKRTLWLPGADHAGFETQVVFDKKLEKEGRNKLAIDRDTLWKEMWEFTQKNKSVMENQLKKLGASCDWSREKFTLDPKIIETVYDTFEKLYDDGLVYRGNRIVNWCNKHRTSLSDLEISQTETEDTLYYLQYGPFVIATARPETKFGDKYVVVHPKDSRYAKYKDGEKFTLEWINGPITATLIKDPVIDMSFGTGAMTITPWHDAADFELAERHMLPKEQIINWDGKLLPIAGEFSGMHIVKARPLIVEKLRAKGLLVKTESYTHAVPKCYKCQTPIEPQILPQWFIKIQPLAEKALKAVQEKKITFIPDRAKKVYVHWMKNIRDWNISRQIVWGIRIPAWYCEECTKKYPNDWKKGTFVGTDFKKCPSCGSENISQDTDVFDTWFSSGQWPFAALGYPHGKDFKEFYPTDVMETGHDILFFWVSRMIMLSLYRTGKIPFKTVYLHGLVRDKDRQKMSKSKGNVIDPLGVAEMYGTDALRMALVIGNTPGNDVVISEDKIRGYRNFATKIWNASRFVLMERDGFPLMKPHLTAHDKKYIKECSTIKKRVASHIEKFKFHLAAETAYHYFWHTFADKIIESMKPRLKENTDPKDRASAYHTLETILKESLTMLHPFMPFVTEAIYQELLPPRERGKQFLMTELW